MSVKKTVYAPLTRDYAIETDWVEIDGQRSYKELLRDPQLVRISDLSKRNGVLDMNMKVGAQNAGTQEEGNLTLRVAIKTEGEGELAKPVVDSGILRLGANESMGMFLSDLDLKHENFEIDGTFGADTLKHISRLCVEGSALIVTNMHITSDVKFFGGKMLHRQFKHDGTSAGDTPYRFPRASSRDENTNIREMAGLHMEFDGFAFLEIPVIAGVEAVFELDTIYYK